jgi:hypothetical protein
MTRTPDGPSAFARQPALQRDRCPAGSRSKGVNAAVVVIDVPAASGPVKAIAGVPKERGVDVERRAAGHR